MPFDDIHIYMHIYVVWCLKSFITQADVLILVIKISEGFNFIETIFWYDTDKFSYNPKPRAYIDRNHLYKGNNTINYVIGLWELSILILVNIQLAFRSKTFKAMPTQACYSIVSSYIHIQILVLRNRAHSDKSCLGPM